MYIYIFYIYTTHSIAPRKPLLTGRSSSWSLSGRERTRRRGALVRPKEYFLCEPKSPGLAVFLFFFVRVRVTVFNKLPKLFPSTNIIRCAIAPIVIRVFVSYTAAVFFFFLCFLQEVYIFYVASFLGTWVVEHSSLQQ